MSPRRNTGLPTTRGFVAHSFEYAFALMFTLVGASMVVSGFELHLSSIQTTLPPGLVAAWALQLLIGGPLILAGLSVDHSGTLARGLERGGLYLATSAWFVYALTIFWINQNALVPVCQGVALAAACIGRAIALSRVDRTLDHISAVAQREENSG